MRGIKALGVAVAALLATALVGVSPATATKLCKTAPPPGNPLTCPAGEGYAGESLEGGLEVGSKAIFKRLKGGLSAGEIICGDSKFTASLEESGLSPELGGIESFEFGNEGEPSCPTTFFGKPKVELTLQNFPYHATRINYLGAAAPQGEMEVPNNFMFKARVLSEVEFTCFYMPKMNTVVTAKIDNPVGANEAKVKFKSVPFELTQGGMSCPTEAEFTATYDLRRTNPNGKIYVTN